MAKENDKIILERAKGGFTICVSAKRMIEELMVMKIFMEENWDLCQLLSWQMHLLLPHHVEISIGKASILDAFI